MIHELKTDPEVFDAVARGEKTFEIRKDDRGFKVGDTLLLRRTRYTGEQMHFGDPLEYTGDQQARTVTHLLRGPVYGLADGWVILSLTQSPATGATTPNDNMPTDDQPTSDPPVRCDDLLCGIFPPHTKTKAMATMQRGEIVDGKAKMVRYEVPVRLMAVTEGYAMVRRPGCSPFVLESKRVRLIPHNSIVEQTLTPGSAEKRTL